MLLALIQNYFQALLQLLGYSRPGPQPGKPALRSPGEGGGEKGRKVGDIMFSCQMIMLLAKGKVGVGFLAMLLIREWRLFIWLMHV